MSKRRTAFAATSAAAAVATAIAHHSHISPHRDSGHRRLLLLSDEWSRGAAQKIDFTPVLVGKSLLTIDAANKFGREVYIDETGPGSRVVISRSSQPLPSGSRSEDLSWRILAPGDHPGQAPGPGDHQRRAVAREPTIASPPM